MALASDEAPICRPARDARDPTGCAGLCAVNREKCQRLLNDAFRCVNINSEMGTCDEEDFTCKKSASCINATRVCDGVWNCHFGEDELGCETAVTPVASQLKRAETEAEFLKRFLHQSSGCGVEEIACESNSNECISANRFCDGFIDCADGSDEAICT